MSMHFLIKTHFHLLMMMFKLENVFKLFFIVDAVAQATDLRILVWLAC